MPQQQCIGCLQVIHQPLLFCFRPQPCLTSCDFVNVYRRPVGNDEFLEDNQDFFCVLLLLLPVFFCRLLEWRQRPFVLASCCCHPVDALSLQAVVDDWKLLHDSNGADDGKRRADNSIGRARHEVATRSSNLINSHSELEPSFPKPEELRTSKAIPGHSTTAAIQTQHHLISGGICAHDDCCDLLPKLTHPTGADIVSASVKIQDPGSTDALLLNFVLLGIFGIPSLAIFGLLGLASPRNLVFLKLCVVFSLLLLQLLRLLKAFGRPCECLRITVYLPIPAPYLQWRFATFATTKHEAHGSLLVFFKAKVVPLW
mmetsp:Transcript_40520/g.72878  ORF Transcript_40520/g.72878 Transcript_40520/m.72878 type:complete len:314 (-) Transcript_40520:282-1223(-)